ncbi:hypothetical protein AAG570_013798 [Ranatra chinensis]|uniref:C2H2-type domain-containing protein n=1 Tax=Ranatra chinensis TaxID=642074 RepID=A0ABD0Z1H0_9HEMI
MEIADDSSMKHVWEVAEGRYLMSEDENKSNWLRWLRPAPVKGNCNVMPEGNVYQLYFVTTVPIKAGDELLFWTQTTGAWASKNMDKTSCGGCNLKFEHSLYYRLHCSVFHEASLSLTVRKYHCKVCGAQVLGKQNIMKHAALYHNGKGAYQCQFCSKYFLRLNYLEMHRNYGCSANPHRARPLCDYCGRKFCQPQKLKVHIKRMHSDISEVLREFQCSECLKVLGSRAALQRHTKEVHKRPSSNLQQCSKCDKTFQNRSNLKIHMLTHSGIKPFKCQELSCLAAFTTKQCLQFHYRKVHGLTDGQFPRIVRSVEYTFDAYAGHRQLSSDGDSASGENGEDLVKLCCGLFSSKRIFGELNEYSNFYSGRNF